MQGTFHALLGPLTDRIHRIEPGIAAPLAPDLAPVGSTFGLTLLGAILQKPVVESVLVDSYNPTGAVLAKRLEAHCFFQVRVRLPPGSFISGSLPGRGRHHPAQLARERSHLSIIDLAHLIDGSPALTITQNRLDISKELPMLTANLDMD